MYIGVYTVAWKKSFYNYNTNRMCAHTHTHTTLNLPRRILSLWRRDLWSSSVVDTGPDRERSLTAVTGVVVGQRGLEWTRLGSRREGTGAGQGR